MVRQAHHERLLNTLTNNSIKEKPRYDIERIYNFIVRVIKSVNSLPKTPANSVIVPQILRSVTSMGSNEDQEADGTLIKKDFIISYSRIPRP